MTVKHSNATKKTKSLCNDTFGELYIIHLENDRFLEVFYYF